MVTMKNISKYNLDQVERDYKYYKERDNQNDASIYFILKEKYRQRLEIAESRFLEAIKKEENQK